MRAQTLSWIYLFALTAWPLASYGACTVNITAGNDTSTCTSATAPGFIDTGGSNTLDITATGRISGNVTFGAGNDLVDVNGPSAGIDGNLDQGDGANIFRLNLGSITGSVTQGAGTDVVQISGGAGRCGAPRRGHRQFCHERRHHRSAGTRRWVGRFLYERRRDRQCV